MNTLTWGEFKRLVEEVLAKDERGLVDDMTIHYIDTVVFPEKADLHVIIDDDGLVVN